MASLPSLVRRAIAQYELCRAGETLLVAFSGGPDSTALLHCLARLAPTMGVEIAAAHLDHGQRPDSADDLRYCQRVAKRLGLPVLTGSLPRARRSEEHLRELRYEFLAEQAAMVGAACIATGHTRTDRVETFLLNLLRGSGSAGLGGLPPSGAHHGVRVIRPLVLATREDVLAYLAAGGHKHLDDPTNRDPRHDRNRVRHELLPLLEALRPGALEAVARASEILAAEADYLEARARRVLKGTDATDNPAPAAGLHRLHPAIGRVALRELVRRARGDLRGISLAMVDEGLRLAGESARDGRVRRLPLRGPWILEARRSGVRVLPGRRGRPLPGGGPRRHGQRARKTDILWVAGGTSFPPEDQ